MNPANEKEAMCARLMHVYNAAWKSSMSGALNAAIGWSAVARFVLAGKRSAEGYDALYGKPVSERLEGK